MSTLRVTTLGTSNTMLGYIRSGESRYYELSQESASGLKVSKPSDDPSAAKSLVNVKTQLSQLNGYLGNMSQVQNELDALDGSMSSLTTLIDNATSLATEAANGTYSDTNLDNIKVQMDQIIQSVVDLANTNYNGTYIFSGTATSTKPYITTTDPVTGKITGITYNGTPSTGDYQRYTTISDGISIAINTTGDQVFGSYDSTDPTPPATSGLLGTLVTISNALGEHNQTAISNQLDNINSSLDTVSVTRTKFASVSNRFQMTQDSINTTITQLKAYRSDLEDADLSQVLSDLATQETALQATYSVTSQLLAGKSLLDYI